MHNGLTTCKGRLLGDVALECFALVTKRNVIHRQNNCEAKKVSKTREEFWYFRNIQTFGTLGILTAEKKVFY